MATITYRQSIITFAVPAMAPQFIEQDIQPEQGLDYCTVIPQIS